MISPCSFRKFCPSIFSNISYWVSTMITSQNNIEYFGRIWSTLSFLPRHRYECKTSLCLMALGLSKMVNNLINSWSFTKYINSLQEMIKTLRSSSPTSRQWKSHPRPRNLSVLMTVSQVRASSLGRYNPQTNKRLTEIWFIRTTGIGILPMVIRVYNFFFDARSPVGRRARKTS